MKPFSKLRDLLSKATPGEWKAYDWPGFPRNDETIGGCVRIETKTQITAFCFAGEPNNDALLIAEAHNALSPLLEALDVAVETINNSKMYLAMLDDKKWSSPGLPDGSYPRRNGIDEINEALAKIKELSEK